MKGVSNFFQSFTGKNIRKKSKIDTVYQNVTIGDEDLIKLYLQYKKGFMAIATYLSSLDLLKLVV